MKKIRASDVMKAAGRACGVTPYLITEPTRERAVAECRQICWYVMRHDLGMTYAEIARITWRHHATVMHGVGQVEAWLGIYDDVARRLERTRTILAT